NLSQVTLGVGDGSTLCQGGVETNEDYLYVVYLKLGGETPEEGADVSRLGYANGELYLTASRDHGLTWSPSLNLTDTKTPWCHADDPESVCASEAWATIARDVDDIHIFYIRDYEAGAYTESGWTMNHAMYLRLPGGTTDAVYLCPPIAPNMFVDLTAEPECEYHAPPGGLNEETLTITNLGNGPLTGEVSVLPGAAWLSVVGAGLYTIPEAGADLVLPVMMDAGALSTGLYSGTIRVTHNDTTRPDPTDFPIEFFVVDGFFCAETNILRTAVASPGVLSLQVATNGRFGGPDPEGGLWRFVDSSSSIFDASLLIAHGAQEPDTVVFHRFYERLDPGQYGFVALALSEIDTTAYGTGQGYAYAAAEMATSDSILGVTAEWFFPQQHDSADFVIGRYTVANRTASPVADIAVAVWADLNVLAAAHSEDLQDGVGNHGHYAQAQNLIYLYGYDTIGHTPSDPLNTSQRYSGGFTYIAGRDVLGNPFELEMVPLRGGVGDNRDNTENGGPSSGLLYRRMVGSPGVTVWEPAAQVDSAKDAYTWLTLDQGLTLAPGEEQLYVIGIVSDTLRHEAYDPGSSPLEDGLAATVTKAWVWAEANVICHCPCHADPACDGAINVLDVVHAVDVAFRGSTAAFDENCPFEQTDVDCTGFTNVLDVVHFVNVAFRGGDSETEFCDPCAP
ncbi:MAG TPA: hypothetical protein VM118_05515, partial [Acidobacteriota bacterium]|nr:hypothetical protein [Acidobacteriota bacterium]